MNQPKNQKLNRGLNRGLDALLAGTGLSNKHSVNNNNLHVLAVNQLIPGKFQPRKFIPPNELAELVESIKTQGILQPLIIRQLPAKNYEIIAGERRWRAAKIAGLQEIPVIIKQVNDKEALTIALIENIQRENLTALDEAVALARLTKEFGLTHQEIAVAVGKSRASITNLLRILNLPIEIKAMLEAQQLELGHAKVLLSAPNQPQIQLAHKIINDSLSVRSTEQLLQKYLQPKDHTHKNFGQASIDPHIHKLQKQLSDTLGAKTTIVLKSRGRGKLVIEYNSLDELEGILQHMQVTQD